MRKVGYRKIVLSGHSTGCQKVTYYQSKTQDKKVDAIILLAPADDYNANKKELGENFLKTVRLAKNMIRTGKGDELLPKETKIFFKTAKRFISVADLKQVEAQLFNYESKRLTYFAKIKCPIFVVFGDKEEYRTKPVTEYMKKLQHDTNSKNFGYAIIKGADHGFTSKEKETAKAIINWLKDIF